MSYYWDAELKKTPPDQTWLCHSIPAPDSATQMLGYCFNFMPVTNGSGADYRFKPGDQMTVWGFSAYATRDDGKSKGIDVISGIVL